MKKIFWSFLSLSFSFHIICWIFLRKIWKRKTFLFFFFCLQSAVLLPFCLQKTSARDTENQVCILTPPCQFSLSPPHHHTSPGISRWGIWRALNLPRCGKAHISRHRQKPCVCCRSVVYRNGITGFSPYIYSMKKKLKSALFFWGFFLIPRRIGSVPICAANVKRSRKAEYRDFIDNSPALPELLPEHAW